MSRGGYRPNAGRPKGIREKKPRKKPEHEEKIEKLPFIAKAEELAVFYKGLLDKVASGKKPSELEKQQMQKLAAELTKTYNGELKKAPLEELLPLEFMLKIMNDTSFDLDMRARMAQAAAPYCHPRIAEGKGKKQEKDEKAAAAAKGRFSAGKPPLKLVK